MKNKKQLSNTAQTGINMVASFMTYGVSMLVSFFLSPYIVRNIGVDAYGFVGLSNNFIGYISLITLALNALAGRFITVSIYKKNIKSANVYYTSVFYANLFLSSIMFVIGFIILVFLEKLINIPDSLYWDVKILFASLMISSIISTITSVFSVSVFANNKLYLNSIRGIESSVARALVLVIAYMFLPPKVYYLGVTTTLVTLYCSFYNLYYSKKLTPYLKISKSSFSLNAVIELTKSGIWSLVTRLGQILTDGLDLLITNLFIDATSMGVLSLAKTVPSAITGIVGTVANVFSPNYTILYAQGKFEELVKSVKQNMKIMGVICNIPIVVLLVCGEMFFSLWQPTQDAHELQILSILTCAGLIINGGINCIYNIFTVVNKLRFNSLVLLFSSLLSVLITFVLLKTTNLGLYAVAGVSTVIMILKNLFLIVPYAAKCLSLKWYAFYPEVIKQIIFVVLGYVSGYFIVSFVNIGHNWTNLIVCSVVTGLLSLGIGYYVILNKNDRKILVGLIESKMSRG